MLLLKGAGGEGKSTVLRQVICDLVGGDSAWNVLWHNDAERPIPLDWLKTAGAETWLFASDDADISASNFFEIVKSLRQSGLTNFQFLLSCRDTDWIGAQADQLPWRAHVTLDERELSGLSSADAKGIVTAWSSFGRRGMGRLEGRSIEEAATHLCDVATNESRNKGEGAFFGAMLRTRMGEDLKSHVKDLLLRLDERNATGSAKNLMEAFAFVAAPHAENILNLTKLVLAETLGCPPGEIKRRVTGPLGEEAAATNNGQYILTRHRAIAEAAVSVLSDAFHVDFDEVFLTLVQGAIRANKNGQYVPDLGRWRYLSTHFFDRGNRERGIRLAQALVDLDPNNSHYAVNLAVLLRKGEDPEQAERVLSRAAETSIAHRALWYEWATIHGNLGNYSLNIWLAGVAIADIESTSPPHARDVVQTLSGMALAFNKSSKASGQQILMEASGAAAQLGLLFESENHLLNLNLKEAKDADVPQFANGDAFTKLKLGIVTAWNQRERELPACVPNAPDLEFTGLARLLKLGTE